MLEYNDIIVYFTIPKTNEAMDTWLPGITDRDKYEHFSVTNKENDTIQSLYTLFNKKFNIIIDNCENETLSFQNLSDALALTEQYTLHSSDETQKKVLAKLISAIRCALRYNTCVYFDF